jgi:hypothetical protein
MPHIEITKFCQNHWSLLYLPWHEIKIRIRKLMLMLMMLMMMLMLMLMSRHVFSIWQAILQEEAGAGAEGRRCGHQRGQRHQWVPWRLRVQVDLMASTSK